jgi:hypothetical protein
MPHSVDDLQLLRLIKAFQKITDQDLRRMVVRLVEEKLEKQRHGAHTPDRQSAARCPIAEYRPANDPHPEQRDGRNGNRPRRHASPSSATRRR